MSSLPAHFYRPLEEKIPEGNVIDQATAFLESNDFSINSFKDIPSIKDILIPQVLFTDFELSTNDCMFQTNGTSKGVIKAGKVIFFSPDDLQFIVVDAKDSGFPGDLVIVNVPGSKMNEYNIVGNILGKRRN